MREDSNYAAGGYGERLRAERLLFLAAALGIDGSEIFLSGRVRDILERTGQRYS